MAPPEARLRTAHFRVERGAVTSCLARDEVDNGLVDLLLDELGPLGVLVDQAAFERHFVDVVLAIDVDEARAWSVFYRNTAKRLDQSSGSGSMAAFARIYRKAGLLAGTGSLLDVGCGFGFFALRHAAVGTARVIGCDASAAVVALAARQARRQASRARFVAGNALDLPFPSRFVETVCLIHLLEHLPLDAALAAVVECRRVARRRVVIAVPFEDEPEALFGHVQVLNVPRLVSLAEAAGLRSGGWRYEVLEADGGWLVAEH